MRDQAQLIRALRTGIQAFPQRWTTLWENQSLQASLPYMTVQVAVADAEFADLQRQERFRGLINFGFVVAAGDSSANSRAEEEAQRIAALSYGLPRVRLTAPPQLVDGYRDTERWRVGLLVRWEELP